jgi:hypothetical protein
LANETIKTLFGVDTQKKEDDENKVPLCQSILLIVIDSTFHSIAL